MYILGYIIGAYNLVILSSAALVPDPVENLNVDVDPSVPSVTLTWDLPRNVGVRFQRSWSDVSSYHIRFKPQDREHYHDMGVDRSTPCVVLKRESGLIPHTTTIFEVRAQCGDDLGEWKQASRFIGK